MPIADLPSGTVTFLFTDIEGSTRLLKQLRERYGEVLSDHQRLLREAFEAAGGREIDTQGDAFFFAFPTAKDGVTAALAGQRALASHAWPEAVEVRVRMGIHTGEPAVGEERYVGLGLHRAARICAAAHGGQILLSDATRAVTEDELPEGVALSDLGQHTLKDLDRPERLFQLLAPDLPGDFPPPRTGTEGTAFGGREGELVEAAQAAVAKPRRRRRALLFAALAAVLAVAVAIPIFAVGQEDGGTAVAVRPNSIVVIDPDTNAIVASIPVGARPVPIATGEGSVWVGNTRDQTVNRIDPETRDVVATIGVGIVPTDLAVGQGTVWVAGGYDGVLLRIDAADNVVRARLPIQERIGPLPPGFDSGPSAVALTDGAVWLAHGEEVSRIDPKTNEVVATIPAGGNWSGNIAAGEGAVWVVETGVLKARRPEGGAVNGISKIDPASDSVEATIPVPGVGIGSGSQPGPDIVAAGAGAVWSATWADDVVWRIDPANNRAMRTIPAGTSPGNVAVGEGAVWVENRNSENVVRIDPFMNAFDQTIDVGRVLGSIAVGEGAVWVTVRG